LDKNQRAIVFGYIAMIISQIANMPRREMQKSLSRHTPGAPGGTFAMQVFDLERGPRRYAWPVAGDACRRTLRPSSGPHGSAAGRAAHRMAVAGRPRTV